MEEQMLFHKIRQGDIASFEQLYKKYHPSIYAFCKRLIYDDEKAKDLVQECFIIFWEHRNRILNPEAAYTYMFRTIRHLCLRQIHRDTVQKNFSNIEMAFLQELEISYYDASQQNILDDMNFKELNTKYEETIDKLPKQCQTIFKMSRNSGMRNEDIARQLNLSVRTVENQLYRGIKIIRKSHEAYRYLLTFLFIIINL